MKKIAFLDLVLVFALGFCSPLPLVAQTGSESSNKRFERIVAESKACVKTWVNLRNSKGKDWKPATLPFEKDGALNFLYEGPAKQVEFVGDITGWEQKKLLFESIPGTGQKCFRLSLDSRARAEYKLIIDGKWLLDPNNPIKVDNGVGGENSVFLMAGYRPTEWDKEFNRTLSSEISDLTVKSVKFGERKVRVYLPTLYFKRGIAPKLPVLYVQDGTEYIERARAVNILENLTESGNVEPFIIVFVDPKDRIKEYWANNDWADFMAREVVPAVEEKYFTAIKTGRENRALLGASLGGITSIWTALKHPEVFSRIGAQSASFWIDDERVVKALEKLDGSEFDFTFYIDDGVFEGVEDSRRVVGILKSKGFNVTYVEKETGHNWTSWRDSLDTAFTALWK